MKQITNITLLVSYSGSGGVEVITNNFCAGLVATGVKVTVLVIRNTSPHLPSLHPEVTQVKLRSNSSWAALPEIVRYLKNHNPDVFMAIKDRSIQVAAVAKRLSAYRGLMVGQLHNNMITGLANRGWLSRKIRYSRMRSWYPAHDHIFAVSEDAARAASQITKLPPEKFSVLPNAVIPPSLQSQSEQPAQHRWLQDDGGTPVVISVGRLSPQKNFALLLSAFALVLEKQDARLIIFGEGKQKDALLSQAVKLGIQDKFDLAGFVDNPFAEIKRASVFALSSNWEGSPTVLTEALALGVPCVATDVGDTKTTLQNNQIGIICEQQDAPGLADAILTTLNKPPSAEKLKAAVGKFSQSQSTRSYLEHFAKLLSKHTNS